ncbi:hypothetical protein FB45DRAFT_937832 [Roridomyces roridus]|uniref:Uncharacterized protein n=1 Tax=Roridomyces roridus TaxID=1738132 RepID=A0AAD7B9C0_9AGAR|nr:hypothetical protein FB45DRAFT_937832 [Roridomyces roridus]
MDSDSDSDSESDTVYIWAVLAPSACQTVAYLDSDLALSAAARMECGAYLALLTTARKLRAYLVQPRSSQSLEAFYPIHPCSGDSRTPIIPPPSFSSFGECVVDTTRALFVKPLYTGEPGASNLIQEDTLGSFPTQHWDDREAELGRIYHQKAAETRRDQLEARHIRPDTALEDSYGVWTAFSVGSRAARAEPGALQAPWDIRFTVSFDLSTARELLPAQRFAEEELAIQRLRGRFSRYGTERAIIWARDQSECPCREPVIDDPIEDLCQPEIIEMSASLEHPEDLPEKPENPDEEDDCSDLVGHFGIPLPRMAREMQLPPPPYADPSLFRAVYFDIFVFIDNESGICDALQPLLRRSHKNLSRLKALSLYFDVEREIKDDPAPASDLSLLHRVHERFSCRLGLTCTPSESAAFAASITNWALVPGAVECLKRLYPYYPMYSIVDIDKESILSCAAFNLIHPYFTETFIPPPECPLRRPDFGTYPVPLDHLSQLPPTANCFVSTSLFQDIEPARFFSMPSVWIRPPGSLVACAPDDLVSTPSAVCDSLASMLPLFVGQSSEDAGASVEVLNDCIESLTLTPTEVCAH